MTIRLSQKPKHTWQGHKPKPSSNTILKKLAKKKGRGK